MKLETRPTVPQNVILKRICIFFVGITIGLVSGYKYGVAEMRVRFDNRMMKKANTEVLPRYKKQPEPFVESPFFEEDKKRRQKNRRQMDDKETPRVRVPR